MTMKKDGLIKRERQGVLWAKQRYHLSQGALKKQPQLTKIISKALWSTSSQFHSKLDIQRHSIFTINACGVGHKYRSVQGQVIADTRHGLDVIPIYCSLWPIIDRDWRIHNFRGPTRFISKTNNTFSISPHCISPPGLCCILSLFRAAVWRPMLGGRPACNIGSKLPLTARTAVEFIN